MPRFRALIGFATGVAVAALSFAYFNGKMDAAGPKKLTVEDRLDILDLYTRYSRDLDNKWVDDFVENVFAPTGKIEEPAQCLAGAQGVRQFAEGYGSTDLVSTHMAYNIMIEGSGDRASGRALLMEFGRQSGAARGGVAPGGTPAPGGGGLFVVPNAPANPGRGAGRAAGPPQTIREVLSDVMNPPTSTGWMGTYTDTFVKLNGKWLFQTHHIWVQKPLHRFEGCSTVDLLEEANISKSIADH
jgi:SnoaL-like protein